MLILLYPNTTSFTQPADKGLNGPIKKLYKKALQRNRAINENFTLTKANFAQLIELVCNSADPIWINNAFRSTGLYPFGFQNCTLQDVATVFDK